MTKLRLLLVAALLFALPAAAATISGTVRESGAGALLGGMTVAAYDDSGALRASAVTNGNGAYTLTLPAGSYRVLAFDTNGIYATSFYNNASAFETSAIVSLQSNDTFTADFTLQRGGSIAGVITNTSGAPINGATVAVYNLNGTRRAIGVTDSTGRFRFVVPPGVYKVAAWDDALTYAPSFFVDASTFVTATTVTVDVASTTTANVTLSLAAHIRGVVTDELTGAPIANAIVTAYDANGFGAAAATTNANGAYDITVRGGSYRLVFEDRSGVYAGAFLANAQSFEASPIVQIADGATRVNLNAALPRAATLTGVVRDASGIRLSNIVVAAYNLDGTLRAFTFTRSDGSYSLLVPSGDFKLAAFDQALVYATRFQTAAAAFSNAITLHTVAPQQISALDFTLPLGGQLTGRVTTSGTPVAGISVAAFDSSGAIVASTLTNSDGAYRLVVSPGTYTLSAFDRALRFVASTASPRAISAGEVQTRDFDLVSGAALRIVVRDAQSQQLVAGVTVAIYDNAGNELATVQTNASGAAAVAVPAGTYRLVASDPFRRYATSYYRNAATFETATAVTIVQGQNEVIVEFALNVATATGGRRRAAQH